VVECVRGWARERGSEGRFRCYYKVGRAAFGKANRFGPESCLLAQLLASVFGLRLPVAFSFSSSCSSFFVFLPFYFLLSVLHFSQVELAVGLVVGMGCDGWLHSAGVPSNNLQGQKRPEIKLRVCCKKVTVTTWRPRQRWTCHHPIRPESPPSMYRPCGSSSPASKWAQKLQRC